MILRRLFLLSLLLLSTILTGSCGNMDTRPKALGGLLDILPDDTSNAEKFRFLYAHRDDEDATSPNKLVVQLKGAENSTSAIISTCNSAGTGCFCDFYDSSNTLLETSASGTAGIRYSQINNSIACLIGNAANEDLVDNVIVRNSDSSIASERIEISTSLSLAEVLHGLDIDKMRTVYRYKCKRNFFQKTATTYTSFTCDDQGANDLSFLHADFTYFLFASNESNNYSDKVVDILYSSGTGTSVCTMQVKEYDCVNTVTAGAGVPDEIFAIYGIEAGPYTTAVTLPVGPKKGTNQYGFAATREEFPVGSGVYICPPGLKRWDLFSTSTDDDDFVPASNMPDNDSGGAETLDATDTELWNVSTASPAPTAMNVQQTPTGDCDGTICTFPSGATVNTGTTYSYSAAGTQFCVIPEDLLP